MTLFPGGRSRVRQMAKAIRLSAKLSRDRKMEGESINRNEYDREARKDGN